jgi:carbon storage regulator
MLIFSRRQTETISLGNGITLTIVKVSGEKVRIGVEAPPHMKVLRAELAEGDNAANEPNILPFPTKATQSDIARFRKAS